MKSGVVFHKNYLNTTVLLPLRSTRCCACLKMALSGGFKPAVCPSDSCLIYENGERWLKNRPTLRIIISNKFSRLNNSSKRSLGLKKTGNFKKVVFSLSTLVDNI
jgi:hypothetical protein